MIPGHRHLHATFFIWMIAWLSGSAQVTNDWRLEFLRKSGFSDKSADLEALLARQASATKGLDSYLIDLGSDDFKTRERAQASILMAGDAVPAWIKGLPRQENPEIRFRLAEISERLRNHGAGLQSDLWVYAASSLLEERKGAAKPIGPPRVFAEWFFKDVSPIENRYGLFEIQCDAGMSAMVKNGRLHFPRVRDGEADQSLMLKASSLELEKFPGKFRISCLMGGETGNGAGLWHAGISVGNVRILYHPGMRGGAFRLETTDRKRAICANQMMGFSPEPATMQRMEISVASNRSGGVEFDVRISSVDGKQVFQTKQSVKADVIGSLDRIGLWRSGHNGGTALFDEFVLDMRQ